MAVYSVSNSAELYDALAIAVGGDTIELAPEDYGELKLNPNVSDFNINYSAPVTIISADPEAPASFSTISLSEVSNLTFDSIVFDYTFDSSHEIWHRPFYVGDSSNIVIRNSVFDGDVASGISEIDDGYGYAEGLFIRWSTDITLEGNEFLNWHKALVVSESQEITIIGNEIHSIRSDGMNFVEVQSVLIEGNHIHDFDKSPLAEDHMDMIQFWTYGTDTPSTDIIIRGNTLDIGEGDWTQSIFMRNEAVDQGLAGTEMYYQNVLIEDNVIRNGHTHAISVAEANGVTIQNNTILSIYPSDPRFFATPTINLNEDSTNVTVEQNVVHSITGHTGQTDWIVSGNAYVQNAEPSAPGYYAELFLESSTFGSAADILITPGSMIDSLGAGASSLSLDTTPSVLTPAFDVSLTGDTGQIVIFDATHTYGPNGQVTPDDAEFNWIFDDGTDVSGQVIEHTFLTPGIYDVTLQVVLPDGTSATAAAVVEVAGGDILAFNETDGKFYTQGYGVEEAVDGSDAGSVNTAGGMAIDLGGPGAVLEVPKEELVRFFGNDAFELSMSLQSDQPGTSWGEVARLHMSFTVTVTETGDLRVELYPDTGEHLILVTSGVAVNDGLPHDIFIRFDGAADSLQVVVDDIVVGEATVVGSMPLMGSWGLTFGHPWGGQNFDGKLTAFDLNVGLVEDVVFPDPPADDPTDPPADDPTDPPADDPTDPPADDPTDPPADVPADLPVLDDFILDLETVDETMLADDAAVIDTANGPAILLDGKNDYVDLGYLPQFTGAEQLSFEVEFTNNDPDGGIQRLVWKKGDFALSVEGDDLRLFFWKDGSSGKNSTGSVVIEDLGLGDGAEHTAMVIADAATDRLQVVVDGEIVFDHSVDFGTFGTGIRPWMLGSPTRYDFDGLIHDFRIDESADFFEEVPVPDDGGLIA